MFKKAALTLFVSAIAVSACYGMEDENENPKGNLGTFKGSLNLCKKEKKETEQAIEVTPQKFKNKWAGFSRWDHPTIDKLVDEHMVLNEINAGILPKEVLYLISQFSVKLANNEDFVYAFPREKEIHKKILALSKEETFKPQTFCIDNVQILCEARHKAGPSKETVYPEFEFSAEEPQTFTKSGIFCNGFKMQGAWNSNTQKGIPIFNYVLVTEDQSLETYQLKFDALYDFSGKKKEIRKEYDVKPYERYNYRKNIISSRPLGIDSAGTYSIDNVIFKK